MEFLELLEFVLKVMSEVMKYQGTNDLLSIKFSFEAWQMIWIQEYIKEKGLAPIPNLRMVERIVLESQKRLQNVHLESMINIHNIRHTTDYSLGFVKEIGSHGHHGPHVLSHVEKDQDLDQEDALMLNVKRLKKMQIIKYTLE